MTALVTCRTEGISFRKCLCSFHFSLVGRDGIARMMNRQQLCLIWSKNLLQKLKWNEGAEWFTYQLTSELCWSFACNVETIKCNCEWTWPMMFKKLLKCRQLFRRWLNKNVTMFYKWLTQKRKPQLCKLLIRNARLSSKNTTTLMTEATLLSNLRLPNDQITSNWLAEIITA